MEGIMQYRINQSLKDKYQTISLICVIQRNKTKEMMKPNQSLEM